MPAGIGAAAGIVRIPAQMIRPAMTQRTAGSRVVAATPTMAPGMVWVVLTGMPAPRGRLDDVAGLALVEVEELLVAGGQPGHRRPLNAWHPAGGGSGPATTRLRSAPPTAR